MEIFKGKSNFFKVNTSSESDKSVQKNIYKIGDITALVPFKVVPKEDLVPLRYAIDLEIYELPRKLKINNDLEELKVLLQQLSIKPKLIYIEDGFFRVVWRNEKKSEIVSGRKFKDILNNFTNYLNDSWVGEIKVDENFGLKNCIVSDREGCSDEDYIFEINSFNSEGNVISVIDFLEEPIATIWREEDEEELFNL